MLVATSRHETGITTPHALSPALGHLLERVRTFPTMAMQRVRRLAPEHVIVAVMVLALVLFAIMLFTSSTGPGRGGR